MVKRVQAKISSEKSGRDGPVDHPSTGPASEVNSQGEASPMLTLDDIDPEQILTALNDTSPMGPPTSEVDSPTPDEGVGSADETADDEEADDNPTMPPRTMPSTQPADLAERALVGEPAKPAEPAREGQEDRGDEAGPLLPTVVRLTDPVIPDQPLNEVASSKSISAVSKDLFTAARLERRKGSRRSGDHTLRLKVPPIIAGEMAGQTPDDSRREPNLARGR